VHYCCCYYYAHHYYYLYYLFFSIIIIIIAISTFPLTFRLHVAHLIIIIIGTTYLLVLLLVLSYSLLSPANIVIYLFMYIIYYINRTLLDVLIIRKCAQRLPS
jgi:hypothetical protein